MIDSLLNEMKPKNFDPNIFLII